MATLLSMAQIGGDLFEVYAPFHFESVCTNIVAPVSGTTTCLDTTRGVWLNYNGTRWLSDVARATQVLNVEDYGALPTATAAANTTAIQAAIDALPTLGGSILIPRRYTTNGALTLPNKNVELVGLGTENSAIINSTSDLFTTGGHTLPSQLSARHLWLQSGVGGGHIFAVPASVTIGGMLMFNVYLLQQNDAKSVWNHSADGIFVDNLMMNVWTQHTTTATVPSWNFPTNAGNVNTNTWLRNRFTNTGNYAVFIGNADAAVNRQNQNNFRDINFEVPTGGAVRMVSPHDCTFDGIGVYDLVATTTRNLFSFETGGAAGNTPQSVVFRNYKRIGGTLGAGLFDIKFDTNAGNAALMLTNVSNSGGSTLAVDLGDNVAVVLNTVGTLSNANKIVGFDGDSLFVGVDRPLSLRALTPAQITATTNNYNPGNGSFWRLSSDASRIITGIVPNAISGRLLTLVNVGSFDIVINNEDASSTAANRIITGTGGVITLVPDDTMQLIYDLTTARWRVINAH